MATTPIRTARRRATTRDKRPVHSPAEQNRHRLQTSDLRIAMHRPHVPDWPEFQGQPKQETPGQRPNLGFTMEPPSGFEPETYALRAVRSCSALVHERPPKGSRCRSGDMPDAHGRARTVPDWAAIETRTETDPSRMAPLRPEEQAADLQSPQDRHGVQALTCVFMRRLGGVAGSCPRIVLILLLAPRDRHRVASRYLLACHMIDRRPLPAAICTTTLHEGI